MSFEACMACQERSPGCHTKCEKYLAAYNENERRKEARKKEHDSFYSPGAQRAINAKYKTNKRGFK